MAISVADDNDENNHGSQPPMKKARIPSIPRMRDKQTDERHHREKRRKAGDKSLLCNVPIPGERFDLNPTGTEEVMRIILLRYLMRVPVPDRRRQQRDRGESVEL